MWKSQTKLHSQTTLGREPWNHIFMNFSGNASGFLGDPSGVARNPDGHTWISMKFLGIPSDSWGIQVRSCVIPMVILTFL